MGFPIYPVIPRPTINMQHMAAHDIFCKIIELRYMSVHGN